MLKEIIFVLLTSFFILVFGLSGVHYTKIINCKLMEEETKIHLKPVFDCGDYGKLEGGKSQYRYVKKGDNELKVAFFVNRNGDYKIIAINGKINN